MRPTSCLCTGCNGSSRVALLLFVKRHLGATPRFHDQMVISLGAPRYGAMFWFSRKKFVGSYARLSSTRRS